MAHLNCIFLRNRFSPFYLEVRDIQVLKLSHRVDQVSIDLVSCLALWPRRWNTGIINADAIASFIYKAGLRSRRTCRGLWLSYAPPSRSLIGRTTVGLYYGLSAVAVWDGRQRNAFVLINGEKYKRDRENEGQREETLVLNLPGSQGKCG